MGYALEAIKEDEPAARTTGINPTFYKLMAFGLGAFVAGGLDAHLVRAISPGTDGFAPAVELLVYAAPGGLQIFWGPLLGATLITSIPELLRAEWGQRAGVNPGADVLIINGLVLLLVILFLPRGLVTLFQRRTWQGTGRNAVRLLARLRRRAGSATGRP